MKVVLQNYTRGQTVSHSQLVIIKGQITLEAGEDEQSGSPSMGGAAAVPFEIRHRRVKEAFEMEDNIPYMCSRSRFVVVVNLELGSNQIKFCDKETGVVFDEFELIYHFDSVGCNDHYIRMLYVTSAKCGDAEFSENNRHKLYSDTLPKLELGLSLVQTLFGEKLYEIGFDRRSFKFMVESGRGGESDDKNVEFPISLSPEEIAEMSTSQLWEYIAKEIRNREDVWDPRCKYVAFVANSWKVYYEHQHHATQGPTDEDGKTKESEKLALGGGGLAVIGTSFLDVWPLSVETILDVVFSEKKLWSIELEGCAARFGAVDRTEGALYAASVGSVMHEMGHIFDLGHTEAGLMGSQFNRIDTCLSPVLSYPPVGELFRPKVGTDVCPMLRPKVGLPSGCLSEDLLSIGTSCATLLYFHKWFQPNLSSSGEKIKLLKNKVVSNSSLVTIQVRDTEDERLLKSWTFVEKSHREGSDPVVLSPQQEFTLAKNHIPIPVCQRGDSSKALVVAEDCDGNLLKAVVSRDSLSESFTVIRRRT